MMIKKNDPWLIIPHKWDIRPGALDILKESKQPATLFFLRHMKGDWGDCGEGLASYNDGALLNKDMVISIFTAKSGKSLLVVTNDGWNITTMQSSEEVRQDAGIP